jgi:hypothetical protein
MADRDGGDGPRVAPMGTRRYTAEIAAPLSKRLKTRLQRAVTATLIHPTRGAPTMRRTAITATMELRACGFSDTQISVVFCRLIEDVACVRALQGTSLLSGQPRWMDLIDRVHDWTGLARPSAAAREEGA